MIKLDEKNELEENNQANKSRKKAFKRFDTYHQNKFNQNTTFHFQKKRKSISSKNDNVENFLELAKLKQKNKELEKQKEIILSKIRVDGNENTSKEEQFRN